MSTNMIFLVGRLGSDPEEKQINDKLLAKTSIAVKRNYKNKDGSVPVDWIFVEAWNKQAELLVSLCKKGSLISLTGNARVDEYSDEFGNKQRKFYVNLNGFTIHDKKEG